MGLDLPPCHSTDQTPLLECLSVQSKRESRRPSLQQYTVPYNSSTMALARRIFSGIRLPELLIRVLFLSILEKTRAAHSYLSVPRYVQNCGCCCGGAYRSRPVFTPWPAGKLHGCGGDNHCKQGMRVLSCASLSVPPPARVRHPLGQSKIDMRKHE